MAIGGAIGAGFFLGSGVAIAKAGPALLIAYLVAGAVMFLIMRALGELTLAYPSSGSFSAYATQFIGPLAGFIIGWSYWLGIILGGIAESTGIALLVHHWYPQIPQWLPALCAVALLYAINMSGVQLFGESEYWLSMIKVVTIVAVLLCGLAILFLKAGDLGSQAGISNLWTHHGFLPTGYSGLISALPIVIFAFGGLEVIGLAAAETENPRYSIPKAINGVFYRVLFLYVGSMAIIMTVFPWDLIDPKESPFLAILKHTGFKNAANIVTLVAVSALFSSCNAVIFASSRMLHGLASSGQAPERLRRLNKRGIPSLSITISGGILMLGVLLNYLIPDEIFAYALTMVAWVLICMWVSIMLSHLFYVRGTAKEGAMRGDYQLPGSPYIDYVVLFALGIFALSFAFSGVTHVTFYILVAWLGLLIVGFYGITARRAPSVSPQKEFLNR